MRQATGRQRQDRHAAQHRSRWRSCSRPLQVGRWSRGWRRIRTTHAEALKPIHHEQGPSAYDTFHCASISWSLYIFELSRL
ncbi:hypothetical protein PFISCL1PPCAC_13488 [Pristionchus fissidentatus]|uniref:Uncharacterized protein n=1 Tax=Pristionchus fissidentatus TaxID=1538716 RepID=A0AAV5VUJ4_9BILA|nr:hypothetical protein PFISCL1PPCAC_13488 [Pristionchus fissidentatus]